MDGPHLHIVEVVIVQIQIWQIVRQLCSVWLVHKHPQIDFTVYVAISHVYWPQMSSADLSQTNRKFQEPSLGKFEQNDLLEMRRISSQESEDNGEGSLINIKQKPGQTDTTIAKVCMQGCLRREKRWRDLKRCLSDIIKLSWNVTLGFFLRINQPQICKSPLESPCATTLVWSSASCNTRPDLLLFHRNK